MSMKLNITALSGLAGLAPEKDEYSDLSNLEGRFPENDSLARAISAELSRKRNETVQQAAAEIVLLLQGAQDYINEEVENLREIRRQEKTKTAILRDLKARMEFASATNNYIVLAYAMCPLNNYSRSEREIIDKAEKAYQTWRARQTAADKGESKAKKSLI